MVLQKINTRLDLKQLDRVRKKLGLDRSKAIRAALTCTENVLQNFFGGEVKDIFRRDPKNETKELYRTR